MVGDSEANDDYGTKKYTKLLSLYNESVPRTLYQILRKAIQRVMAKFGVYGSEEIGHDRFARFCEWGAEHLAMAPQG